MGGASVGLHGAVARAPWGAAGLKLGGARACDRGQVGVNRGGWRRAERQGGRELKHSEPSFFGGGRLLLFISCIRGAPITGRVR